MSFNETGLDPRILRAVAKHGFAAPTAVQAACIPCALQGKDIVARARTGSGKTLAYLLPGLHRIVTSQDPKSRFQVLILVPSRELCAQVAAEAHNLSAHCGVAIGITNLTGEAAAAQRISVVGAGALVIATPGRLATALREGWLSPRQLGGLKLLVLDEADLLLSYGHEEDLQMLAPMIPRSCQVLLMSATSSEEVERLQKLVLHNPVTLNLLQPTAAGGAGAAGTPADEDGALGAGGSGAASEIAHFQLSSAAADKMLVTMALLKLGLLKKKVLIFVNGVDEGVRLRLFLEAFGLRMGCVHAELPVNSRSHILASFNKGLFDYLIATDDVHAPLPGQQQQQQPSSKKRRRKEQQQGSAANKRQKDAEFGVTRGIDFKGVRTVINYDPATSVEGYVHRVGRTGRAGQQGTAISLFTPAEEEYQQQLQEALEPAADQQQQGGGQEEDSSDDSDAEGADKRQQGLRPFTRLTLAAVEALRYRGEDVGRALTKKAVREARVRELEQELLNSSVLQEYFEEHEAEKALLRHDKPMHRKHGNAPHLKHLPSYLKDPAMVAAGGRSEVGGVRMGGRSAPQVPNYKGGAHRHTKADPLKGLGTIGSAAAAGAGSFIKAPKKGGSHAEELTELEKKALANPIKPSKAQAAALGLDKLLGVGSGRRGAPAVKGNVRKVRPTMGAGAKRPRR